MITTFDKALRSFPGYLFVSSTTGEPDGRDGAEPDGVGAVRQLPLRVLIVEDEAILSLALESMIEDLGHEVVGQVSRGAQAIETAKRLMPDVILMDIKLADDIDGVTAAESIRTASTVPIIFISAYSDAGYAARTSQLGAPLLSKPVARTRLEQVLKEIAAGSG
jgi:YesN/AraC family two-component response regulator